jgi:hypothetical protein
MECGHADSEEREGAIIDPEIQKAPGGSSEESGAAPRAEVRDGGARPAAGRVRLFYEKRGGACFVPHIALASLFTRAANRAGIRLQMTEGFSPHAKMSFGPELPAGVAALSEPLDIWLEEGSRGGDDAPRLAEKWNGQMPEGFRVVKCLFPPEGAAALGKDCKAALYWVWGGKADPGELLASLERHYGAHLLDLAAGEDGVRGARISFVVSGPAQNGIGGWVRALTAAGAVAGWQDLRIARAALGRWNGAGMEPLAGEGRGIARVFG